MIWRHYTTPVQPAESKIWQPEEIHDKICKRSPVAWGSGTIDGAVIPNCECVPRYSWDKIWDKRSAHP